MGFLRSLSKIFLVIILTSCIKPIKVDRYFEQIDKISHYGLEQKNNFFVNEKKPSQLKYEWDERLHGSFRNSAFVAFDSLIILADLSGRISVLNTFDGKKTAEIKYSGGIEQAPIIIKSYMLFIVNELKEKYSTLVVYDLVNGKEVRTLHLKGKFGNELSNIGDFVYAVSNYGAVYKIANWGNIEWKKEFNTDVYSNPVADDKYLFFPNSKGEIYKIELEEGELVSKIKIGKGFQSGLNMDANNLFIGDDEGVFYSISKLDGEINWTYRGKSKIVQTPGLDIQNVYFGNLSGDFISLNKENGKINWIYESNGLINTSPLIFENILIQPNLFMNIDIIDKYSGELLNQLNFDTRCRTTPIYYKERIFFGVDKGEVYCYSFIDDSRIEGK